MNVYNNTLGRFLWTFTPFINSGIPKFTTRPRTTLETPLTYAYRRMPKKCSLCNLVVHADNIWWELKPLPSFIDM